MAKQGRKLTPTEWKLMECLWALAPCTGREASDYLAEQVGWSRSTTLTLLGRMTKKGLVRCQEMKGVNTYSPLVKREDAVRRETADFLERVYRGSVSMMMSAITEKQQLSDEEIAELYEILRRAEEGRQ